MKTSHSSNFDLRKTSYFINSQRKCKVDFLFYNFNFILMPYILYFFFVKSYFDFIEIFSIKNKNSFISNKIIFNYKKVSYLICHKHLGMIQMLF